MKRWKTFLGIALALLLTACSRSAERYTVVRSWEARPGEHLYAYTVEMPEDIRQELEKTIDPDRIGYLLPVRFPKHLKNPFNGTEAYWCTVYDFEGKLLYMVQLNVDAGLFLRKITVVSGYSGWLGGSGIPAAEYWKDLAGYTSEEKPLSVYMESICTFLVIGEEAYPMEGRPQGDMEKTDSFTLAAGAVVKDILRKE